MLLKLVSMTCIMAKATPTNDTDYSYYIQAVELIIWGPYHATSY